MKIVIFDLGDLGNTLANEENTGIGKDNRKKSDSNNKNMNRGQLLLPSNG
jgi:hypothetical protein